MSRFGLGIAGATALFDCFLIGDSREVSLNITSTPACRKNQCAEKNFIV
jgi:hypothetical protein